MPKFVPVAFCKGSFLLVVRETLVTRKRLRHHQIDPPLVGNGRHLCTAAPSYRSHRRAYSVQCWSQADVHRPGRGREEVVHSDVTSVTFDVGSPSNWKWPSSEIFLEEALQDYKKG